MTLNCIFYHPAFFMLSSIPCSSIYSCSLEFNYMHCNASSLWHFYEVSSKIHSVDVDILLTFDFGRNTPHFEDWRSYNFVVADGH